MNFKKNITSPVVIGIMILFLGFNIFLVLDNTHAKNELVVLNKVVDKFGYEINDAASFFEVLI